jgi:hypothetical protein
MNIYWAEIEKAYNDMFQGKFLFARRRLDVLLRELNFFLQNLINLAKEWNDPKAEQWEAELKKSRCFPFGFPANR